MLTAICALLLFSGCGAGEASEETPEIETAGGGLTLEYPSYMKDQFGDALVLEEKPEKIVALSNSAMQILGRLEIEPVGVSNPLPEIDYPDYMKEVPVITTGRADMDAEAVIALEPDLLIMGSHLKDNYEKIFTDAGIEIYYTTDGPSITYDEIKEEARVLAEGFGSAEFAEEIQKEFEAVEKKAEEFSASMEEKTMMILFSTPPTHQQTSKGYLGSMLKMLPFKNLSDEVIEIESRTAPLDQESLIQMNPEVFFAVSPLTKTAEEIQGIDEAEFASNPAVWGELQAIKNGNVIYLPNEYVTSRGIHIINSLDSLIDRIEEKLGNQ